MADAEHGGTASKLDELRTEANGILSIIVKPPEKRPIILAIFPYNYSLFQAK